MEDLVRLTAGAASVFLALLFLRAALHKASDLDEFEAALTNYGLAPLGLVWPMARLLPALELACGAFLLTPAGAGGASVVGGGLAVGLLILYAAAMAWNLAQGRRLLDCGCGGAPLALSWALVARNLALAAAAAPAALGVGRALSGIEAAAMAGVGAAAWLVALAAEKLASNHARMRGRTGRLWAFSESAGSASS